MIDYEKLPTELTEMRNVTECNFIFALYKEPDLIEQYNQVKNTVFSNNIDGIFYYGLLQNMWNAGFKVFNHMDIYDYTNDKPALREGFEQRGGYQSMHDILTLVSPENIDVYYDDLVKNNLLIRLHDKGFSVLQNIKKFQTMTAEQVYDFWEYQLSDIQVEKIDKIKEDDLSVGYDKYIDQWNQGNDVGYEIGIKMLNYKLLGIHKKNLMLHLSGIGFGKTTSAIAWYIIPALENGESVLIIANEQDSSMWRNMLLSTVMFNKIKCDVKGLDRHKLLTGNFNQEQIEKMKEAATWLNQQKGKAILVETNDYSVGMIKKILSKYSRLGIGLFVIDTLKTPNDANERAYAEFIDIAKELFFEAKRLDIAVVATAQLSPDSLQRKFLDLSCIGRAKQISEVADSVVMFRPLTPEEREKIHPYKYDGKVKEILDLDPDKDYIMIFTPKNRYGNVQQQMIVERNMAFNSYKEVGWFECSYDSFNQKR